MKPRVLTAVPALLLLVLAWLGASSAACADRNSAKEASADVMSPEVIRESMTRAADWQLAHPQFEPDDWTNGVFYTGLLAAHRSTGERRYLDHLIAVGESLDWRAGERYRHADDHVIAQTWIELYELRGDSAMITPFRRSIDRMMATPPDWEKGHQSIDFWWSDALFMSPPALARLARATGNDVYLEFMDELWQQSYELLWDDRTQLFYRDTRFRINDPGEFWSRGNAWVIAGLARMLEVAPESRPARELYIDVFRQMAASLAAIQPDDGLWRASLLAKPRSSSGETSGTALVCYAMAWGIRHGLLDRDQYMPFVYKAWWALNQAVNADGRLGRVQKPGASPQRVRSWHSAPYGTGAFLLAGEQVLLLAEPRE